MMKRTLLSTAAMLLIAAPVLAQAPEAPAGGDRQFTAPPTAGDRQTPDASATMEQRMEDAAVAAPAGEVLAVETSSQVRADALIGKKVVGASGEDLGTVDDIIISNDGKVSGLLVKTGSVMGIGGKSVGIAWQDVAGAIDAEAISLPMSKDQLEQAPEFSTREDRNRGDSALPRLPAN